MDHFPQVYSAYSAAFPNEQWENIVITVENSNFNNFNLIHGIHPRFKMSYIIRNLEAATNYEARVQARNEFNWNKLSSVFHFSTRAEDMEQEPSAQPAVSKNAGKIGSDAFSMSNTLSFLPAKFLIFLYILGIILSL